LYLKELNSYMVLVVGNLQPHVFLFELITTPAQTLSFFD